VGSNWSVCIVVCIGLPLYDWGTQNREKPKAKKIKGETKWK
jgi:hypothetical protein